ncbi:MAG: M20/M25/M40 family metallo-hydrolase, partial [Planctomycetes bacterium]|nr:M20/M25/M40 family metallo-hydrolase [Planctomycetota bacterium]
MTEARRTMLAGLAALMLLWAPDERAAEIRPDGAGGTLAVVIWAKPDFASLQPLRDRCWLVTHSQDMAVLLLPLGFQAPGELKVQVVELEPVRRGGGAYYLHGVEDASKARFEGDTKILARSSRTVLLWSSDEPPRLAAESRQSARGLLAPLRVTISPKVWPLLAGDASIWGQGADQAAAKGRKEEFDTLVDSAVAEVDHPRYVQKWQILDDFETRYFSRAENEQASQWIHDTLESFGLEVEYHTYSHQGTRRNVVGTLPGLVEPEKVVYMTAHFDSINRTGDQAHAPGADDNASGVTAFLEAARILSSYEFAYTIKFVGFNSEEQGMIGSRAYVASIPEGE